MPGQRNPATKDTLFQASAGATGQAIRCIQYADSRLQCITAKIVTNYHPASQRQ
jgi:hypothetical protein